MSVVVPRRGMPLASWGFDTLPGPGLVVVGRYLCPAGRAHLSERIGDDPPGAAGRRPHIRHRDDRAPRGARWRCMAEGSGVLVRARSSSRVSRIASSRSPAAMEFAMRRARLMAASSRLGLMALTLASVFHARPCIFMHCTAQRSSEAHKTCDRAVRPVQAAPAWGCAQRSASELMTAEQRGRMELARWAREGHV